MMKKLCCGFVLCLLVFSLPTAASETVLPRGSRYVLSEGESHLTRESTGIYLFPGDGLTEVWIDGVRLAAGEARILDGDEEIMIVPLSDGCFSSSICYWLAGKDSSERVEIAFAYAENVKNLPEARDLKEVSYARDTVCGRLSGSSPYGEVSYILLTPPQKGRVELDGGAWFYYCYDGEANRDSFRYAAVDKLGRVSSPACVTLEFREAACCTAPTKSEHFARKRAFLQGLIA